eukprot:TRINITY_DN14714_c0_g1_i3.p1 TRINITY_DN14714_c0_g1~~TRINITY_DN14714_c0_g1_i3.p1  ORF type:complete len:883 (+),score=148.78 TRINITY_DN14714_c0_g1_i3:288-2651(+)
MHRFLIGLPACMLPESTEVCDNATLVMEEKLNVEMADFGDILRVPFDDGYRGLVLKTVYFHTWVAESFSSFDYVLKTDDDVFVRLDLIIKELDSLPSVRVYWGFVWLHSEVIRSSLLKNYEDTFPYDYYPPFVTGGCVIMSSDLVEYIGHTRHLLQVLDNEDTSVGVWMSTLRVKPRHDPRFQFQPNTCFPEMLTRHPMDPLDMKALFHRIFTGRRDICETLSRKQCPLGYPSCEPWQQGWSENYLCDDGGCLILDKRSTRNEMTSLMKTVAEQLCSHIQRQKTFSKISPSNILLDPSFVHGVLVEGGSPLSSWHPLSPSHQRYTLGVGRSPSTSSIILEGAGSPDAIGIVQEIHLNETVPHPLLVMCWHRISISDSIVNSGPMSLSIIMELVYEAASSSSTPSRDRFKFDLSPTSAWHLHHHVLYPARAYSSIKLEIAAANVDLHVDSISLIPLHSPSSMCEYSSLHRSYTGTPCSSSTSSPTSPKSSPLCFFFVWTTSPSTFQPRHMMSIESVLYHHPDACVRVYSNMLPKDFFAEYAHAGRYDLSILPYDLFSLASGSPGASWVHNFDQWQTYPHFYAHSADYLRFLLLYKYGGIYSDTDSILLTPLDATSLSSSTSSSSSSSSLFSYNFIGMEWCESDAGLPWCDNFPNVEGVSGLFSLSIGLMGFQPRHPLIAQTLSMFDTDYTPDRWGCGTVFISLAYKKLSQISTPFDLAIHAPSYFYPLGYQTIPSSFDPSIIIPSNVTQSSVALHLFGKVTADLAIQKGSHVYQIMQENTLTKCNDGC